MRRFLLAATLASLLFLSIGTTLDPSNQIFWFASDSTDMQLLRGLLGVILLVQLITKPPRNMVFRLIAGMVATTVGVGDFMSTMSGEAKLLDTVCLAAAVAAMGVTTLELEPLPAPEAPVKPAEFASPKGV